MLDATHALFKALIFMCAGGVIHSIGDSQDIRFMGGLSIYIPFVSSSLMVSNFALCGIPFLAGFYSRDYILEIFSMRYVNVFGFLLLFLSTGLTVCYATEVFIAVLIACSTCFGHHYAHHQELKSIIQWMLQHSANRTHNPQLHTRPAT